MPSASHWAELRKPLGACIVTQLHSCTVEHPFTISPAHWFVDTVHCILCTVRIARTLQSTFSPDHIAKLIRLYIRLFPVCVTVLQVSLLAVESYASQWPLITVILWHIHPHICICICLNSLVKLFIEFSDLICLCYCVTSVTAWCTVESYALPLTIDHCDSLSHLVLWHIHSPLHLYFHRTQFSCEIVHSILWSNLFHY